MSNFYKRVLLVEDDHSSQLLISKVLMKMGYLCDVASDGDSAIEHINLVRYELIITDILMPTMNGFELCDYIRSHVNHRINSMKIIGMSADESVRSVALGKGMDYFIEKPIDLQKLKSLAELCLASFDKK